MLLKWLTLLNSSWLDMYSKFYTKVGFEPTIHLRLMDITQAIWNPRCSAAATWTSCSIQPPRPLLNKFPYCIKFKLINELNQLECFLSDLKFIAINGTKISFSTISPDFPVSRNLGQEGKILGLSKDLFSNIFLQRTPWFFFSFQNSTELLWIFSIFGPTTFGF